MLVVVLFVAPWLAMVISIVLAARFIFPLALGVKDRPRFSCPGQKKSFD